jgi:hypothetical protein
MVPSSNCCGRHTSKSGSLFVELDDTDKAAPWQPNPQRELPVPRSQSPRKDRRDVLTRSLKDKSAEPRSGYRSASGHGMSTGSEVGSLAGRGSDADSALSESLLEDSENPWTCALVLSGLDRAVGAHTQTTATTSEPVVRGRVPASSQTPHYSKVGVALLKVPFPLPDFAVEQFRVRARREHAGHRVPVPVPAVAPIRVSPQYLCLNAVTVARLVQILVHQ